ncbi:MAG: NB-ARC domain-containing protein [Candidatus Omnitrophica bacterium]|nr:NB-ARC domain-containing protein [Candidatus Omnitrophota bacterium]
MEKGIRFDDIARAIKLRNASLIVPLIFAGNPPLVRSGFRTETELWDYKNDCPPIGREANHAWAEIAKDVLAFYNNKGGIIIFGIDNSFSFKGARVLIDSKMFNDKIRKFLGDRIWVDFHREFIQDDQRYVGLALIPPRGALIEKFYSDAPIISGKKLFTAGDSAIREGDSNRILRGAEVSEFAMKLAIPTIGKKYEVDEPFFRILSSEYTHFVERKDPCADVEKALKDPRTTVTSIIGIGGVGKTALATWAVLRAYGRGDFNSIISITAKDRELTSRGILAIEPKLTTFESLLDNILDILGFPEIKEKSIGEKEKQVCTILEKSNSLLYIDNLETVDDARIITFLEELPLGVRAIITSRRPRVRKSVYPIDLGPLTKNEIIEFINSLQSQRNFDYIASLSQDECVHIGSACDGIPLAIRWVLSKSTTPFEAIKSAENITSFGKKGEELLEFCFRRVFDQMSSTERTILEVLSLFQRPLSLEPIIVGVDLPSFKVLDAIDLLVEDALIQRLFDPGINDYSYVLLPVTRTFVYAQVLKQAHLEENIRKRMSDWFEAKDIKEEGERLVVRELRQGRSGSESALVDLAIAAERRQDYDSAEELFDKALQRNPKSWLAARLYGEFLRHKRNNITDAIQKYGQAASNAPLRGSERALIFREWGMLLRDSGDINATDSAIEKFKIALVETPNDPLAIFALAQMLDRKGSYLEIIKMLEPLENHQNIKTRKKVIPLLLKAYEKQGEMVKAATLRPKLTELGL